MLPSASRGELTAAGRPWHYLAPAAVELPAAAETTSFSVLIAAHNVAEHIGDAISSALNQTLTPLEVIVCDDGSDDALDDAIAPYTQAITLIRQPQSGVGAAKRSAAAHASGDFIVVLDADDTFTPERLEVLAALSRVRPDIDLLTSDAWVELEGKALGRFTRVYTDFVVESQRRRILELCYLFPLVAIRRSAYEAAGGFDAKLRSGVDWDLWIRMMLTGSQAAHIEEPLAHYRIREGSVTSDGIRRAHGHVRVIENALANPNATASDRITLSRTLRDRRRQLLLTELEQALREGQADARWRAIAVALRGDVSFGTRVKCAASAVAPAPARRFLQRRDRRVGRSRLGRPLRRHRNAVAEQ